MLCHLCLFCLVSNFRYFSTNISFYGVRLSASRPTPNLEDQSIPFCLGHHLWPVWHVTPYEQCHFRQDGSQDHLTTQAPPLRQSRDTFGGVQHLQKCFATNIQNKTLHFRSYFMWNCSLEEITSGQQLCKCCLHKWYKFKP